MTKLQISHASLVEEWRKNRSNKPARSSTSFERKWRQTHRCFKEEKNSIKDNITPNKIHDHQDGLLTTKEFLGNWSAASFSQYKTPPPKTNRDRTDSETSANNMDFASAEGIRALLKGKLVPGSYVSPQSGMLIFIFWPREFRFALCRDL